MSDKTLSIHLCLYRWIENYITKSTLNFLYLGSNIFSFHIGLIGLNHTAIFLRIIHIDQHFISFDVYFMFTLELRVVW